jgi:hypothetical protein
MKEITEYINIFIGLWFAMGIAVMASLATFTLTYQKRLHNKKEALKKSIFYVNSTNNLIYE